MTIFFYLLGFVAVLAIVFVAFALHNSGMHEMEKVADEILDDLIMNEKPLKEIVKEEAKGTEEIKVAPVEPPKEEAIKETPKKNPVKRVRKQPKKKN